MEFSEDIKELIKDKFQGRDIYKMSLEELKNFRVEVEDLRHEYSLIELAYKTLGNAGYGSCASPGCYFFNVDLAGDITAECRNLTETMNKNLTKFFHEDIWNMKDLWKKFDFALDESKHDWYRKQAVWIYSDTDSIQSNSKLDINVNGYLKKEINIEELFNQCIIKNGLFKKNKSGHEITEAWGVSVKNYKNNHVEYVPIKYVIRHKVNKEMFKITAASGKCINVTCDHSCIVLRGSSLAVVKAKDILLNDKLITLSDDSYNIEDVSSVISLGVLGKDYNTGSDYVYDIEVADSTHSFFADDVLVHNSSYTTYGNFFECFTPEYQEKYKDINDKVKWILKFNQEFLDQQNTKWCHEIYDPRHAKSIHKFELETISYAGIYLKKKKYAKGLAFSKGKFFSKPKLTGTGIEIIKSTSPVLCRKILKVLFNSLMFEYKEKDKIAYVTKFNHMLSEYRKEFYKAPVEDISQSVNIGAYKKFVVDDENSLELAPHCPVSVHAIARYNYLAHKNGDDNLKIYTGKIKYYNIREGKEIKYFGYPAGECPSWAPKMDKMTQWKKNVIDPINRFLEVMDLPLVDESGVSTGVLF